MSRSRLYPYREAIREALDAGTSLRALARTYDVHRRTLQEFVDRWIPEHRDPERHIRTQQRYRTYDHSFAGVVREHRRQERDALERLEDL